MNISAWVLSFICIIGIVAASPAATAVGEIYEITNDLGHVLFAGLFKPDNVTFPGKRPAIVVAHGTGGVYDLKNGRPYTMDLEYRDLSETITSRGYVALFVDSYNPKSGRPVGKDYANAAYIRTYDIYAGRALLTYNTNISQYVNASDISALGISHGSTTVVAALEDSDPHVSTLPFKAGIGFYACCGPAECTRFGYTCAYDDTKCGNCSQCSLCSYKANTNNYCPYAPLLIFAADNDTSCSSGYNLGYNPGYGSDWGQNWCDNRIEKQAASCTKVKSMKMVTYKQTEHGFNRLPDSTYAPNNVCAHDHATDQTFNWIKNGAVSIQGSTCAWQLYP